MSQFGFELGLAIFAGITDESSVLQLFPLACIIYYVLCFLSAYYGVTANLLTPS